MVFQKQTDSTDNDHFDLEAGSALTIPPEATPECHPQKACTRPEWVQIVDDSGGWMKDIKKQFLGK